MNIPLKILFVINGLGTGGAERSLAEMLPLYANHGVTPIIACFHRRSEGVEEQVLTQGVDVRFLLGTGHIGRIKALRRLITEEKPDLIQTAIFEADLAGRLAAVGLDVPVVSSIVNISYSGVRLQDQNVKPWKLGLVRLLDGWTARHLTFHHHAITQAVKEAAVQDLNLAPERITVVERGRDPERLGDPSAQRRSSVRQRLNLHEDDEIILNVARQEYQKGQIFLVEAMQAISQERPKAKLLIAGRTGNASSALQRRVTELDLGERIQFLGHRNDVPDLLAAADLFAFPSLYEGLGGALIEAMALGLPIVATDLPVLREVVEVNNNARLVPSSSPQALAAAIETLLDDKQLAAAYAQRSCQIFRERFQLESSTSRMVTLFRDVVHRYQTSKPSPSAARNVSDQQHSRETPQEKA